MISEAREKATPAAGIQYLSQHPRTNECVCLQGFWVAYYLQRSQRKSIAIMVGSVGLCVKTPVRISVIAIEQALHEKGPWIVRKLEEQAERARRVQATRIDWRPGKTVSYLGQAVNLPLGLPPEASPEQRRRAAFAWFQRQAVKLFSERLDWYAHLLSVRYKCLKLSSATTRWGSTKNDGTIRLNWRLLHFDLAIIDYVVVHELSHLYHMNHSPDFWSTVHSVMPDYKKRRQDLKESLTPLWD